MFDEDIYDYIPEEDQPEDGSAVLVLGIVAVLCVLAALLLLVSRLAS